MTVFAFGINHRTASVELRGKAAIAPERMEDALRGLVEEAEIGEVAILSTCNRTEVYCAGGDMQRAINWFAGYVGISAGDMATYSYEQEATVRHIMKVASGLDSMILGEPQILGQLKSAYAVAREVGTVDTLLNQIFQQSFTVAKRVRTETAIGQSPVSVAYAAVSLSQQIFATTRNVSALLIGAGETIELVARHLKEKQVGRVIIANRTLSHARELAQNYGAEAILLADIADYLQHADMVISSTASQLPVLGKGAVESALKKRRHRPMFMVDIAVPRDIEPEVGELADVYLYTVDDLKEVIQENRRNREDAAVRAEEIIESGVETWLRQYRALGVVDTIRAYRNSAEGMRDDELLRALRSLENGVEPEQVVKQLARNLTNKLLHTPTTKLMEAGEQGQQDYVEWANTLFGLDFQGGNKSDE